jgi:hypothetical protein
MKKTHTMIKKIIGALLLAGGISSACAQPLPPGNYSESCNSIQYSGGVLQAYCPNFNGTYLITYLYDAGSCTFIQNINGELLCTNDAQVSFGT